MCVCVCAERRVNTRSCSQCACFLLSRREKRDSRFLLLVLLSECARERDVLAHLTTQQSRTIQTGRYCDGSLSARRGEKIDCSTGVFMRPTSRQCLVDDITRGETQNLNALGAKERHSPNVRTRRHYDVPTYVLCQVRMCQHTLVRTRLLAERSPVKTRGVRVIGRS